MTTESLNLYEEVIRKFVDGEITPKEFERAYLSSFKDDRAYKPEKFLKIINELFWIIEDYVDDPEIRDEGDLDEEALRQGALKALLEIQRYKELEKDLDE